MIRIADLNVLCPICGKDDWCMIADDYSSAICSRPPREGAVKQCGRAGWLYILKPGQFKPEKVRVKPKPNINWNEINKLYKNKYNSFPGKLDIGLRQDTLRKFDIGYDGFAFTFPMYDAEKQIVGMQARHQDGRKITIKGSSVGIFIPNNFSIRPIGIGNKSVDHHMLFITEGMSDTAALTELGYPAIGRYNCCSCNEIINTVVSCLSNCVALVVVVSDRNDDEYAGAVRLLNDIQFPKKLIIRPTHFKDIRTAYMSGMTKEVFLKIVADEYVKRYK